MARGTFNNDGTVSIVFDPKKEHLYAPNTAEDLKYLPCERCGEVEVVTLPTTTYVCFFCRA